MLRSVTSSGIRLSFAILAAYGALTAAIGSLRWSDWRVFAQHLYAAGQVWVILLFFVAVVLGAREVRKGDSGLSPFALSRTIEWRSVLWPPLLYTLLLGLFGLFKQRVLILADFTFDRTFHEWDRAIFGTEPWRLSHPSPWLTEILGASYYGWYAPMLLGTLAIAFVAGRPQFRSRYILAFVLTWLIVGSLMAFLLPAAGPCYWEHFVGGPNPYAELMENIRRDVAASATYNPVLDAQAYLLRAHGRDSIFGGGISAMPSMHIALATLFACGAWSLNRWFGATLAVFALVIWWASVHLGWHYFVDGLVAIPPTLAIWWACGRLYPETRLQPGKVEFAAAE